MKTETEKEEEIKKLKEAFPQNESYEKAGIKYTKFVIQKIEFPKQFGKKYININYDENNVPYAVLLVSEGITEKEKQLRKEKTEQRRKKIAEQKKVIMEKAKQELKAATEKIRSEI